MNTIEALRARINFLTNRDEMRNLRIINKLKRRIRVLESMKNP